MTDDQRHVDTAPPDGGGDHVSPELISAYLADGLTDEERRTVQDHLVRCGDCRADLIEASALGDFGENGHTPGGLRRWWMVAAPAAAAILAALLLMPDGSDVTEAPVLRGQQREGTARFEAVSPQAGQEVGRDSVVFTWRSEGPRAHYVMTLTDENGDVLWNVGTSDTILGLPEEIRLVPGETYFWYVDALLEGAQSSTTGVEEFRVRE